MINYYHGNNSDTIWFSNQESVITCNYMIGAEKSHNKCQFKSFGELMNGFYTIYVNSTQYKGTFKEGLFENGTVFSSYENNSIQMLGQYVDNWKIGFWTIFYENGQVHSISKFIEGKMTKLLLNGNLILMGN